MNIKIFAVGVILILPAYTANAANCTRTTCPSGSGALMVQELVPEMYCASYGTKTCWTNGTNTYAYRPCINCPIPYSNISTTFPFDCGTTQFSVCTCYCSNCESDTDWSDVGTGYQKIVSRWCDCDSGSTAACATSTSYRCATGYYGSSSNGTSGCSPCPTWREIYASPDLTGVPRGTSLAGATAITGCYIAPGTYYDETGAFKISSNCPYTN